MPADDSTASKIQETAVLRAVVEGTASETGRAFFDALVENLAAALGTHGAWITRYVEERQTLETVAFCLAGQHLPDYEFTIPGSPCEQIVAHRHAIHIPDRLLDLYPDEADAKAVGAVSYLGVPLEEPDGRLLGHLAVMDLEPLPEDERVVSLFQIFANRALAEMRRVRLEDELREREDKLARLLDGAMDAIVELDEDLRVTLLNDAGEKLFGAPAERLRGDRLPRLLSPQSRQRLESLIAQLEEPGGPQSSWIPGGLDVSRVDGTTFPAEATVSRFHVRNRGYYVLVLRSVDDRLEAERKIHELSERARYLQEELDGSDPTGIIGQSAGIRRALRDVQQVAATNASVLIYGETGTGKELFARAIHDSSDRKDGPLIKVNCAAIPISLVESELFGHERGAFTGATQKRDGRFALADGGTIFLDEIGELPLDLQGKLLRVLQEGEFEPVGSSLTQKVDVRVVAATHRDLVQASREGSFRQDLYYRLSVFPLELPPLRERGDDVTQIAAALVDSLARSMGRTPPPLEPRDLARLRGYPWPGNVRELRNVIERALITSREGRLDLDRALPEVTSVRETATTPATGGSGVGVAPDDGEILTDADMREFERRNIVRALEATGWQVGGSEGAAALLDMPASTLKSRIKAFGISKPQ